MNCDDVRQHWNLYHDSEGDVEMHFHIEEHLAVCADCAEWFHHQSRLEDLLVEKLAVQSPTPEVWNRVFVGVRLRRRPSSRRWMLFSGIAACAAGILLALLWTNGASRDGEQGNLVQLTSNWHDRLTSGAEPLQFRSGSDLEVEGYLRQRVSFPVRCPPRKDAGFSVEGAGVCTLAQQPAAYLAGRVEEAPASIFILPRDGLAAFPHQRDALRKAKTLRCVEGKYAMVLGVVDRNAVLVVGQSDPDRLERVLHAYGTYEDH